MPRISIGAGSAGDLTKELERMLKEVQDEGQTTWYVEANGPGEELELTLTDEHDPEWDGGPVWD